MQFHFNRISLNISAKVRDLYLLYIARVNLAGKEYLQGQQKQSNQQIQKVELNISKAEEKSVADEMKKAVDNPLWELLNPVKESDYIPHKLFKE